MVSKFKKALIRKINAIKLLYPGIIPDLPFSGKFYRNGLPEGLDYTELEKITKENFGESIRRILFRHISTWKNTGAYRLALKTSRRTYYLIYKNSMYKVHDIAALERLPIKPGPPEYFVYNTAYQKFNNYLPKIYMKHRSKNGNHYRYLMEDLGKEYVCRKDEDSICELFEQLPKLHSTLEKAFNKNMDCGLLSYDYSFSAKIIQYAERALKKLADRFCSSTLIEIIDLWESIERLYLQLMNEIYSRNDVFGPIHGDLNSTNIMFHRKNLSVIKLIDWEWAGYGIRHSDLASYLKTVPKELEYKAISIYQQNYQQRSLKEDTLIYLWCKLQRGLFDAAFFAKQKTESVKHPEMDLDNHIESALGRALNAFYLLEK
jgi:thiamine kinase-like enzyme